MRRAAPDDCLLRDCQRQRGPEDAELADALDELKQPDICSLVAIVKTACGATLESLLDRRCRLSIPYRLERCGYIACPNPDTKDGPWVINNRRQTLYAKTSLTPARRLQAAHDYVLRQQKTAGSS